MTKRLTQCHRRRQLTALPSKVAAAQAEHQYQAFLRHIAYAVLFYDTHAQARNNIEQIQEKASQVRVLNVVIKAEGSMDDPEILAYGRMFAGEAWYLIHTRRKEGGFYDTPQPKPSGVIESSAPSEPTQPDGGSEGATASTLLILLPL